MARGRSVAEEPAARGPAPRANPDFFGHPEAEIALRRFFDSGRLPHALLIGGPRGIGKATLAFRFARFVLAQGQAGDAAGEGLAIAPESGTFRRVAAAGHADLLTVERAYDPRRHRLRSEIVVDDTRAIAGFLHLTAAEEGWRVVVVDGADAMNRNAASVLLKILEEPPLRALVLLVAHSPGRLLPTIRSRCRRVMLGPLPPALVRRLVRAHRPGLDEGEATALATLADGSVGRALELAEAGGVGLYRTLLDLLAQAPRIDAIQLHVFADRMARADAELSYRLVGELVAQFLARLARAIVRGPSDEAGPAGEEAVLRRLAAGGDAARWAHLRAEIEGNFERTDALNLDRKQAILGTFFAIAEAAG